MLVSEARTDWYSTTLARACRVFGTYVEVKPYSRLAWTNEEGGEAAACHHGDLRGKGRQDAGGPAREPSFEGSARRAGTGAADAMVETFDHWTSFSSPWVRARDSNRDVDLAVGRPIVPAHTGRGYRSHVRSLICPDMSAWAPSNESRLSCGPQGCWRAARWFGWRGWSGAQMAFHPPWRARQLQALVRPQAGRTHRRNAPYRLRARSAQAE